MNRGVQIKILPCQPLASENDLGYVAQILQFTAFGHCEQVANKMTFGQRLRDLQKAKRLSLRELASRVDIGSTYLSKIENHKLEDGNSPSGKLLPLLDVELGEDQEEWLLLVQRVPEPIRRRVIARPDAFRRLADLSDRKLDSVSSLD